MMRLCFIGGLVIAAGALVPIMAFAQTASESRAASSTEFRGTAPGLCVVRGAAQFVSATNASLTTSTQNAAAIQVTSLVAQNGSGIANAADLTLRFPVICTVTHDVTIRSASGGMIRAEGSVANAAGFRTLLDYEVQTVWAGATNSAQATALPQIIRVTDAAQGDLSVRVSIPQGGIPLVAGSYADTLTINLAPTL